MKSVKRVACIVMVALLFCAVFAMSAMAAGASINVAKEVAIVGGETQVTVTVSIPAGTEIGGASVRLNYDSTKLSVVSSASGVFPSTTVNTNIAGQVRGNFFTSEGISTGGVLYTVTFKVAAGKTVGESDISVDRYSLSDANGDGIANVTANDTFTCPHSWNSGEQTKAPSCFETGVTTYTCTLCGDTKTEPIATVDHTWDEGEITTDPTCSTEGIKTFVCTVSGCTATRTEPVAIDSDAHSWDNGAVTTAPTCTAGGVKTFTCQHNSAHTYTESIDPLGHDIIERKGKEPTCEEDGWKPFETCSRCNYSTYEAVDAIGHDWDEGKITTEPTCEDKGVKTYTCKNDSNHTKTEDVDALGHDYADKATFIWTEDKENATWTATYSVECEADGCDHKATGNAIIEVTTSTAENCQEVGTTTYKATITIDGKEYSDTKVVEGAAGPHSWDEGEITTKPTCEDKGVKTYTCTVNGCNATKTEDVDATGHNYESKTVAGHDENGHWYSCDNGCDVVSDAEPHEEGTPATCSSGALCVCGREYGEVDPEAHEWDEGVVDLEPDCTTGTPGNRHYTCKLNEEHIKDEEIPAEHTWDEGTVTREPTTSEEGERTFHCTVEGCEGTKTEPIAKLTPSGGSGSGSNAGSEIVGTGDEAQPILWLFVLVAGISLIALVVSKKRSHN